MSTTTDRHAATPDGQDPRHIFLDAHEVMRHYGWGKTRGYQNLKDRAPRPRAGADPPEPLAPRPASRLGRTSDGRRRSRAGSPSERRLHGRRHRCPTSPAEEASAIGVDDAVYGSMARQRMALALAHLRRLASSRADSHGLDT